MRPASKFIAEEEGERAGGGVLACRASIISCVAMRFFTSVSEREGVWRPRDSIYNCSLHTWGPMTVEGVTEIRGKGGGDICKRGGWLPSKVDTYGGVRGRGVSRL